jgi:hypothetical protein
MPKETVGLDCHEKAKLLQTRVAQHHAGVVRFYAVHAANGSSEHQSLDHQDCLQVLIVE